MQKASDLVVDAQSPNPGLEPGAPNCTKRVTSDSWRKAPTPQEWYRSGGVLALTLHICDTSINQVQPCLCRAAHPAWLPCTPLATGQTQQLIAVQEPTGSTHLTQAIIPPADLCARLTMQRKVLMRMSFRNRVVLLQENCILAQMTKGSASHQGWDLTYSIGGTQPGSA